MEESKMQRAFAFASTIPHASIDTGFLVTLEAVSDKLTSLGSARSQCPGLTAPRDGEEIRQV